MGKEKIVSPEVKVARVKSDYKGVKIVTGVDYQSIYNDGVLSYLSNDQDTNIWQNGFITSKKRFVDAKEAMKIAIEARQITSPVDLVMAMKNRIKMAKLDPEEYGGESYIKHIESEIKAIDIAKTELKPEDLY